MPGRREAETLFRLPHRYRAFAFFGPERAGSHEVRQVALADIVRLLRVSQRLTQAQVATLANLSQPTVSAIELGRRPTPAQIRRLAHALGVPVRALTVDVSLDEWLRQSA